MATRPAPGAGTRTPLTRGRIFDAALRYVDEHGLAALSMHKLGAELGVKGMSLYNHVDGKDDVLGGLVEAVWAEAETSAAPQDDWRAGYRALAHGIRRAIYRHPNAAPLLSSRPLITQASLRAVQAHITAAVDAGVPEERAYAVLRTLTSYALGSGLAEVSWGMAGADRVGCGPGIADLLRPGTPADLAAVAEVFCGQSDPDAQFELGLDLMLRGIDCPPDA